ncbi:AI-2E family transporter [Dactylosporangium vinaceum]|uniref:AI-2E family transporter n=1 Tax=Dactylosporangium vinaceum TaxID=53362 RepID=A0ABV5M7G6_9ACTN|nr:AI-2E family transporter [Dactylosporangium vinaceum]UAB95359.1 AI-2E family transporter [Dactylosporangium vinaceum]
MSFAKTYRLAIAAGLGLLTVAAGAFAVYSVRQVLVQVLIALFVAVSLDPAVRLLIRHGVRRSIAVAIIAVLVLAILVGFVWSLVPQLVGQAGQLLDNVPHYQEVLQDKSRTYREVADRYGLTQKLTEFATSLPEKIGGGALGVVTGIFSALVNVLLVTVLTLYFMADLPRLRRGLVRLVPRANRPRAAQAINVVVDKVGGYMIGNLIISLVAGVSVFICLIALGVPYALPLAVWVALTDLIPMIGAGVGAVGCCIVALVTGDVTSTVVLIVFFLIYQQIENYIVAPRVLRNTVDLSSVAILLAALTGAAILGLVGALMSIPIAAAIKVLMTPVVETLNEPPPREPPAEPPVPIPAPRDEDSSKLES